MLLIVTSIAIFSCEDDDLVLGGAQSPMGEVGNEFTTTHNIPGLAAITAEITELQNGVSTLAASAEVTNQDLVDLANAFEALFPSNVTVNGNVVTAEAQVKFTEDGISIIDDAGELIIVSYGADVGDQFSLKIGANTITNKVMAKSTTDDYFWNGMLIKVLEMEATGFNAGGLDKVTYFANHKFGIVGINAFFDNNSDYFATVYSDVWN